MSVPQAGRILESAVSEAGDAASSAGVRLERLVRSLACSVMAHRDQVLDSQEVEAIHKMRVSTRRLQSALDLLQRTRDDYGIKPLKRKLRGWRRALSIVRNYDVFIGIVEAASTGRAAELRRYRLLKEVLGSRRESKVHEMIERLREVDPRVFAGLLGDDFDTASGIDSKPGDLPRVFRDERAIAFRALDRLHQRIGEFQALAAGIQPSDDPSRIHAFRIAAKRLRYLIETLGHIGFSDPYHTVARLKVLQDKFGDLHDFDALEEEIIRITGKPKFIRERMNDAAEILAASSRLLTRRVRLKRMIFPVRVPRTLSSTSTHLTRMVSEAIRRAEA